MNWQPPCPLSTFDLWPLTFILILLKSQYHDLRQIYLLSSSFKKNFLLWFPKLLASISLTTYDGLPPRPLTTLALWPLTPISLRLKSQCHDLQNFLRPPPPAWKSSPPTPKSFSLLQPDHGDHQWWPPPLGGPHNGRDNEIWKWLQMTTLWQGSLRVPVRTHILPHSHTPPHW